MSDRGQSFTLEAFVAAILLIATVAFALHAVAITANTASVGDTELRNQQAGIARGLLDEATETGTLQTTLAYWNESAGAFHGADEEEGFYISEMPANSTEFGESMGRAFGDRQVRYNIDLHFWNESGDRETQRLVEAGSPSDGAVRVVETVTLYDDTPLVAANGTQRETTLAEVEPDFYAPDVDQNSPLYNVVQVEVVLWKT